MSFSTSLFCLKLEVWSWRLIPVEDHVAALPDALAQQHPIKGESGEVQGVVAVVVDQLSESSPGCRGQAASVSPEATGHVHVGHVGVGTDDGASVKMVHVVVNWMTVNNDGFVEPESECCETEYFNNHWLFNKMIDVKTNITKYFLEYN